jgi:predicted naringenin-chalcone synthase
MGVEFFRSCVRVVSHTIFKDGVACHLVCGVVASGSKAVLEYATHTKKGHFELLSTCVGFFSCGV